jgi:lipoprotein-releasing system ATP-binding protein
MVSVSGSGLRLEGVTKTFQLGPQTVEVLRDADLELAPGDALAITGPSGSGKSTLLHLIGTLDAPTSGTLRIGGRNPFELSEPEVARFRNGTVGFIFQDHHLLPQYTVLENVLIPTLAFKSEGSAEEWARELLERVGLGDRLAHRPAELSGGERQRVAVARALVNRPALLLCDEPTGNLDRANANAVIDLLFELHRDSERILIVVTHSPEIAKRFPRRAQLIEGRCVEA